MTFRRGRQHKAIRNLVASVHLSPDQFIYPLFVYEGLKEKTPLSSLAFQYKHHESSLLSAIEDGLEKGIRSFLLFTIPEKKWETLSSQKHFFFEEQIIKKIKEVFKEEIVLITDLCLCSYTKTGHCGLEHHHSEAHPRIDNHSSVEVLVQRGLMQAAAGADMIAPSDMMDDRIKALRLALDESQLYHTMIMSYSSKFSSQLYGPFREAAQSTPSFGDRKSYQIDPRHHHDAIRSSIRDASQGADLLMVKPAGLYLDILKELKQNPETSHLPLCAYQVSGEYQSYYLLHEHQFLSFPHMMLESFTAIKRAGADLIISYGAPFVKEWLHQYSS
jgi:porphobilinogen synthase